MTIASVDPRHGQAVEEVARPTTAQGPDAVCAGAAAAAAALGGMHRGARAHPLQGALTGTINATSADSDVAMTVADQLAETVGRVVWTGYPTGVAVTWAMHHGGPYPAAIDGELVPPTSTRGTPPAAS